jgi:hypothetical protein
MMICAGWIALDWVLLRLDVHQHILALSAPARYAATLALLIPAGVMMGGPFPLSLRLLHQRSLDEAVPWAWGVNAAFTAVGSSACLVLGMWLGFSGIMALAVCGYLIASLAMRRLAR